LLERAFLEDAAWGGRVGNSGRQLLCRARPASKKNKVFAIVQLVALIGYYAEAG
jgi:hypothetical protein